MCIMTKVFGRLHKNKLSDFWNEYKCLRSFFEIIKNENDVHEMNWMIFYGNCVFIFQSRTKECYNKK